MRDKSIIEAVARETGISEADVQFVAGALFRQLHKRQYEYEDGNGDYICEELVFELDEFSWIHLYQFLTLRLMRTGSGIPEDIWAESTEQLQYMGGSRRWQKYFHETGGWKMSRQYGLKKDLYG